MNTAVAPLTTEQLIEACDYQGHQVSTAQLGRWVRAGLIPASLRKRHGRGRGLGAEWLWQAECQERAAFIAQTLTTGDPSLRRAARVLAAAGYALDAECLRQVLLDRLDVLEHFLLKRQPYLTDSRSVAEKRRRLKRSMRRKTPDMPDELFQRFSQYISAIFGLVSLEERDVQPVFHHMQSVIALPALRQRLQAVEGAKLLVKYDEASQALPAMATLALAMLNVLMPALAEREKRRNPEQSFPIGVDAAVLLAGLRQEGGHVFVALDNPIGEMRLYFTLFLAALAEEEQEHVPQWAMVLGELLSGLATYLNIPPKQAATLTLQGLVEAEALEGAK